MRHVLIRSVLALAVAGCVVAAWAADTQPAVPEKPQDIKPLKVGDTAPAETLTNAQGEAVDLAKTYAAKPTVLVFYRGGWCPYCNVHLADLAKVESKLIEMGYQIVAASPESAENLKKTADKNKLKYTLLSDAEHKLARGFGVSFGKKRELPVPSVFIINTDAKIQFVHFESDYKKRLSGEEVVAAAKKAKGE